MRLDVIMPAHVSVYRLELESLLVAYAIEAFELAASLRVVGSTEYVVCSSQRGRLRTG